jgi:CBS domain containing-hemolysin-like protein
MEDAASRIGLGLAGVLALVLANGFFVAAEFALVTVRKTRIDQLIAEGNRRAPSVRRAVTNPDGYIAATQLGITMASIGLGWLGEPAIAQAILPGLSFLPSPVATGTAHTVATAAAFAFITALHIVLGELAPKTIALQHAERTALYVARPTEIFMKIFWPFIAMLNAMGRAAVRALGLTPPSGRSMVHSEEELKMLVTASQEAGVLEETEEQMLHRVFEFADFTAGHVMVPRTELVALPLKASLADVLERVSQGAHDWLPVYDEDLDDIVGILHVAELCRAVASPRPDFVLRDYVRDALIVPETMKADALLGEMRRLRTHHAVVIDEYGGTAGLVTFEGLMERIVGEMGPDPLGAGGRVRMLAGGAALVDGLVLLGDINEQFGLHIDEATYNTLGGYVLGRLGRRARIGDLVEIEGRTMRVEALDGLRVALVLISGIRS